LVARLAHRFTIVRSMTHTSLFHNSATYYVTASRARSRPRKTSPASGVPITQYCEDHHLTSKERLELFLPVCIIHRDLKPSNVLVPVPKSSTLASPRRLANHSRSALCSHNSVAWSAHENGLHSPFCRPDQRPRSRAWPCAPCR
jgi:hypothetical protein